VNDGRLDRFGFIDPFDGGRVRLGTLGPYYKRELGLRDSWLRYRWVVLLIGLAFAAVLTHFWSLAMFAQSAQ
jgi:hypothetical protein